MRKVYIADDGKEFAFESQCIEYEDNIRKQKLRVIQKTMQDLDNILWKKYHPDWGENGSESVPELHLAHLWLRTDIVSILIDDEITDVEGTLRDIISTIQNTECGDIILDEYIQTESILQEAAVRRDFFSALESVKSGGDLGSILCYQLYGKDLERLARLHRSNKCRRKIEDLLTTCNFHYECGKFHTHEYAEFLKE